MKDQICVRCIKLIENKPSKVILLFLLPTILKLFSSGIIIFFLSIIDVDFIFQLHTGDNKVSLEIEFEMTSVESISRMLQTVVRMKICSGTALEKERQVFYKFL